VSFSAEGQPAFLVLRSLLRGTQIDIIVLNAQQVILTKRRSSPSGQSRGKHTLSGYVTDAATGEALVGANVFLRDIGAGMAANTYGFYSLTLPRGEYIVQYSYLGYASFASYVVLDDDVKNDVHLQSRSIEVDTVLILSKDLRRRRPQQRSAPFISIRKSSQQYLYCSESRIH